MQRRPQAVRGVLQPCLVPMHMPTVPPHARRSPVVRGVLQPCLVPRCAYLPRRRMQRRSPVVRGVLQPCLVPRCACLPRRRKQKRPPATWPTGAQFIDKAHCLLLSRLYAISANTTCNFPGVPALWQTCFAASPGYNFKVSFIVNTLPSRQSFANGLSAHRPHGRRAPAFVTSCRTSFPSDRGSTGSPRA